MTRLSVYFVVCLAIAFAFSAAVVQADSVLNFPRATFVRGQFTGYAIANPTDTDADVTVTAYRADGTVFASPGVSNPAKLTIRARQQRAFLLSDRDIFNAPDGLFSSADPVKLWLQVSSPVTGLTGFYLLGDTSSPIQTLDGSGPSSGLTDALFLLINEGAGVSTDLKIINPGDTAANVNVEFHRVDGTTAGASTFPPLAPKAALQGKVSELFPSRPSDAAYVRFKSPDGRLAADALFQNTTNPSLAVLSAQRIEAQASVLNFPQLVDGGDWFSEITIVNVSDKTIIATFRAYQENGSLFVPPALNNNTVQRVLSPGGMLRVSASSLFGFRQDITQVGWLQVEGSDVGLTGYVGYGTRSTPTRAIVAAQQVPVARAVFSHQAEAAGFFTGLAILNASTFTANVEVYSLNVDGSLRGLTKKAFKPNQRESKLLHEWIPAANGAAGGYILVRSDVPIIATELFGTVQLTALANVPPQPIDNDLNPAAGLPTLKISPSLAVLETKSSQQFQAQGISGSTWSLDSADPSDTVGSVNSSTGLYNAPQSPPKSRTVTLLAKAPDGSQTAGATVDIVERKTLASGLSVVRAVAYLAGSKRLFLAEQQALGKDVTSGGPTKISELKGASTQPLITINDTVEKMLPFTTSGGKEILLLAGFDSGSIYRFDPASPQQAPVAVVTGLAQPTSMAFADTGDLVVAEQGSNTITFIPRAKFDSAKADLVGTGRSRRISAAGPQGVAVDSCTGEVFYTDAQGNLIGDLEGLSRTLFTSPGLGEILAMHRGGTRCPSGLTLFVVDSAGNQILRVDIGSGQPPVVFLPRLNGPTDITFLPQGNPFASDGSQSGIVTSDRTSIVHTEVAKLYTQQSDPIVPPVDQRTVTISGSGSFSQTSTPNQIESVAVNLTFTGIKFVSPSDLQSRVAVSFGAVTGTLTGSGPGGSGVPGTVTVNGKKTLAYIVPANPAAGTPALAYLFTNYNATDFFADLPIVYVALSGADYKTVDYIAFIGGTFPDQVVIGIFVRKGGSLDRDNTVASSSSNFKVNIF
ncbi:MAG TPA: hypothetical protein VGL91_13970 [Acidobacteriota bacterium]